MCEIIRTLDDDDLNVFLFTLQEDGIAAAYGCLGVLADDEDAGEGA